MASSSSSHATHHQGANNDTSTSIIDSSTTQSCDVSPPLPHPTHDDIAPVSSQHHGLIEDESTSHSYEPAADKSDEAAANDAHSSNTLPSTSDASSSSSAPLYYDSTSTFLTSPYSVHIANDTIAPGPTSSSSSDQQAQPPSSTTNNTDENQHNEVHDVSSPSPAEQASSSLVDSSSPPSPTPSLSPSPSASSISAASDIINPSSQSTPSSTPAPTFVCESFPYSSNSSSLFPLRRALDLSVEPRPHPLSSGAATLRPLPANAALTILRSELIAQNMPYVSTNTETITLKQLKDMMDTFHYKDDHAQHDNDNANANVNANDAAHTTGAAAAAAAAGNNPLHPPSLSSTHTVLPPPLLVLLSPHISDVKWEHELRKWRDNERRKEKKEIRAARENEWKHAILQGKATIGRQSHSYVLYARRRAHHLKAMMLRNQLHGERRRYRLWLHEQRTHDMWCELHEDAWRKNITLHESQPQSYNHYYILKKLHQKRKKQSLLRRMQRAIRDANLKDTVTSPPPSTMQVLLDYLLPQNIQQEIAQDQGKSQSSTVEQQQPTPSADSSTTTLLRPAKKQGARANQLRPTTPISARPIDSSSSSKNNSTSQLAQVKLGIHRPLSPRRQMKHSSHDHATPSPAASLSTLELQLTSLEKHENLMWSRGRTGRSQQQIEKHHQNSNSIMSRSERFHESKDKREEKERPLRFQAPISPFPPLSALTPSPPSLSPSSSSSSSCMSSLPSSVRLTPLTSSISSSLTPWPSSPSASASQLASPTASHGNMQTVAAAAVAVAAASSPTINPAMTSPRPLRYLPSITPAYLSSFQHTSAHDVAASSPVSVPRAIRHPSPPPSARGMFARTNDASSSPSASSASSSSSLISLSNAPVLPASLTFSLRSLRLSSAQFRRTMSMATIPLKRDELLHRLKSLELLTSSCLQSLYEWEKAHGPYIQHDVRVAHELEKEQQFLAEVLQQAQENASQSQSQLSSPAYAVHHSNSSAIVS